MASTFESLVARCWKRWQLPCAVLGSLLAQACVGDSGQRAVRSSVEARLALPLADLDSSAEGRRQAARLLAQPLTADAAAQVALLRSPRAAIVLAKLAEAGASARGLRRLPNPHAELGARFGAGDDPATLDASATLELTELVLLGYRFPASGAELRAAQAEAVSELLVLAHAAKRAYYMQQANLQAARLEAQLYAAADAALATTRALRAAGNTTELELARQEAAAVEAKLRLADVTLSAETGQQALRHVLGLWKPDEDLQLDSELPPLPKAEPAWLNAEKQAVSKSLEIIAAVERKSAAEAQYDAAWVHGVLPKVGAGVGAERDGQSWSVGPLLEVEVPLFDQGQAERAGALASVARHEAERSEAGIGMRFEIREVVQRLHACRQRVERYEAQLLPQRREILEQSLLQYNAMTLSVFQLLDAQRALNTSEVGHVAALRDYWLARTDLAQLLAGTRLNAAPGAEFTAPDAGGAALSGGH